MAGITIINSCHTNNQKVAKQLPYTVAKGGWLNLSPKTTADSDRNDSIAIAQVDNLPEVKNLMKSFKKTNKDTTVHMAVLLAQRPDKSLNYYWIKVGMDGPYMFQTLMHFYVDPKDLSVRYYDPASDSTFTLAEWRKSSKHD